MAIVALGNLSESIPVNEDMAAEGGVELVCKISKHHDMKVKRGQGDDLWLHWLMSGSGNAEAARTLRNFVANDQVHGILGEGECLPALLGLARSEDTETEAYAVWALEHLSSFDRFQTQIVHDGGLEVMLSLAKSDSPEVCSIY